MGAGSSHKGKWFRYSCSQKNLVKQVSFSGGSFTGENFRNPTSEGSSHTPGATGSVSPPVRGCLKYLHAKIPEH